MSIIIQYYFSYLMHILAGTILLILWACSAGLWTKLIFRESIGIIENIFFGVIIALSSVLLPLYVLDFFSVRINLASIAAVIMLNAGTTAWLYWKKAKKRRITA